MITQKLPDVEGIYRYISAFLDAHDFGLGSRELEKYIDAVIPEYAELYERYILKYFEDFLKEASAQDVWEYSQTLRYAFGAALISQNYRKFMVESSFRKSNLAKFAYKCQTGILDDVIDKGSYSYPEALKLYKHVLFSMTADGFETEKFQDKLNKLLKKGQMQTSSLITTCASEFNRLFYDSPNHDEFIPLMRMFAERVALGQALTIHQKKEFFDIAALRRESEKFYAPDKLKWHEKLAAYISGGTRFNIIDLLYAHGSPVENFDNFLTGWYYYDVIIVYFNNAVNVAEDLKKGIYNLSLIAMSGNGTSNVTSADYERHISRLAEFARSALRHATAGSQDSEKFYQFITLFMPAVMMAEWIGKNNYIELFLEKVSPAVKKIYRTELCESL